MSRPQHEWKSLPYPHLEKDDCPYVREDFAPDETCEYGALPEEPPTQAEVDEIRQYNDGPF